MALDSSLLGWLRCFESAARTLSFTRASDELNITQGAVSQQIRHLEQRLHCHLFERASGGVTLTRQGFQLQGEIGPALRKIERAIAAARSPTQPLQINCSPSFALRWLIPRLGNFAIAYPEIELRLKAEFHSLNAAVFSRDGIDVAVRYDPYNYTDLESAVLMDDKLLAVVSPELFESLQISENPFCEAPLLHDAYPWDGATETAEWDLFCKEADLPNTPSKSRHFNLSDLALGAARAGQGIAIGRLSLIIDELKTGKLLPLCSGPVNTPARYIVLTAGSPNPRIMTFVNWLRNECTSFVRWRDDFISQVAGFGSTSA